MNDSPTPPSNEAGNVPAWHTNDPIYDAAQVRGKVLLEINRQMQYCACYANLQEASRQLGELSKFVYSLDARGSGRATWEGDVTHGLAVRALTVYHGEIAGGWPHESVSAMRKALAAVVEAPAYRAPPLPSPPPQPDAGKVSFSPFNRIAFERWLYRALDENWAGGMPERWQCQQACAVIAAEIDSVLSRAPAPPGPAAPEWEPYLRHLVSTLPTGTAVAAGEWIACSERMPEESVMVLIYSASRGAQTGWRLHNGNGWCVVTGPLQVAPSHWIPHPPPPGTVKAGAVQGMPWSAP